MSNPSGSTSARITHPPDASWQAAPTSEQVRQEDALLLLADGVIGDARLRWVGAWYLLIALALALVVFISWTISLLLGLIATPPIAGALFSITVFCLLGTGQRETSPRLSQWCVRAYVKQRCKSSGTAAHRSALHLVESMKGWRPRDGAPHPPERDDTHDRWRVEATSHNDGIFLYLRHWRCDEDRIWHAERHLDPTEVRGFAADAEGVCQALAARIELQQRADWLTAAARQMHDLEGGGHPHVADIERYVNRTPSA